ncbi:MAG: RES family NAD+ phosphorylase [Bryobacteraceae bacterium]
MKWLWRISNYCDLSGMTGEKSNGRWHTRSAGKRIVYLAEHPALALIEVLVHLKNRPDFFPSRFQLMKLVVGAAVSIESLDLSLLSSDWREDIKQTQSIGDAWLAKASSALLSVPSAAVPESTNYLSNPLHRDGKGVEIEWCKWIHYDKRMFPAVRA